MRERKVKRVVDARGGQGRVILWLECGHKMSIGFGNVEGDLPANWRVGENVVCSFCDDPPPPAKSAVQLWREAGEP